MTTTDGDTFTFSACPSFSNDHGERVEGLAEEIAPLGIRSLVVEPGMMRTNFLDPSTARQGNVEIADYAEAMEGFRSFIAQANGAQQNDPEDLAVRVPEILGQCFR